MKRAVLLERRRFVEEPEVVEEMNLLSALLLAVEALRSAAEMGERRSEIGRLEKAAALLDKKAMKLRAREEASIRMPEFCLCGNTKRAGTRFCTACFAAIPVKLWGAFHSAPRAELMGQAWREIEGFVKGRRGSKIGDRRSEIGDVRERVMIEDGEGGEDDVVMGRKGARR